MGSKLYCGNLSYDVDSSELQEMFGQYGSVTSAEVIADRDTGRSKGFGFVQMGSEEEAQAAIEGLNGKEHGGRALTVNEAKPKEPRSGGGGGGGVAAATAAAAVVGAAATAAVAAGAVAAAVAAATRPVAAAAAVVVAAAVAVATKPSGGAWV